MTARARSAVHDEPVRRAGREPMPGLDKRSPVPLYYQLRTVIEERIDSGEWPPDTLVPSERELCEQFRISRITVRQALAELVRDGRLVRSHGRGTFVAHSQVKKCLLPLMGFSEDIRRHGQRPGARVLQFEAVQATPSVTKALQLGSGEQVLLLRRLRLANGTPMAMESVHLPIRLLPGVLEESFEDRSLYEILKERYNIVPTLANQQWQAVACPPRDAALLGIRKGSPVFSVERTTFDQSGRPFEYVESFFRGDKYIFFGELKNQAWSGDTSFASADATFAPPFERHAAAEGPARPPERVRKSR
jgi:GntR family transcriptional regulator